MSRDTERLAELVDDRERFARTLGELRARLGAEFPRWLALGRALATATHPGRVAVRTYCALAPARVARVGMGGLAPWVAAAVRVGSVSRQLAETFVDTTAPFLGAIDGDTLGAWADAGTALHADSDLRRSVLAHAFFAAAPRALPLLAAAHFGPWQRVALGLQGTLDPAEALRGLPTAIAGWSIDERTRWLETCLALTTRGPAVAARLYRHLPGTLDALAPASRHALLVALRRAAEHAPPAEIDALIPVAGALVPADADALALLDRVGEAFPRGVPALLRTLGRVLEDAPGAHASEWVARGLALARDNPEAGHAYFGLESRTSLRVLHASSTAVELPEVAGVLGRFVHMLSGMPALPRAGEAFRLRPPLEDDPTAGTVTFPALIDRLDTVEDNGRLYRVAAAMHAGRREGGTYDAVPGGALAEQLHAPERPAALAELFLLTDGYRVACRLARSYPGIAADLRWAAARLLARWTDADLGVPGVLLDALLALALRGDHPAHPSPALRAAARIVLPALSPLSRSDATAADALATAERLTGLFEVASARAPALELLESLGAMMLDGGIQGLGFDGDEPGTAALAGGDADGPEITDEFRLSLDDPDSRVVEGGRALTPEELRRLVEAGVPLGQGEGTGPAQAGLYVTQLAGKALADAKRSPGRPGEPPAVRPARAHPAFPGAAVFTYDEWDYLIGDYRPDWCALRELPVGDDAGHFFHQALVRHADLVPEIRRHFQRVRPETYRPVRGLEDGEDFDLNAAVDAHVDRRLQRTPSTKLYTQRYRQERDVATLFLLDMSASTDETRAETTGRIIDIAKEALVLMAAALEEIGDAYAIYGFSGQGRDNVQVFPVKSFAERLSSTVKGRIGGIEPQGSTRMGTALRHAASRMRRLSAPARHLVLLSDGFPQDFDYGQDRTSHTYGIRDTAVALREVEQAGIRPFCITVDVAGHDYLREMCDGTRYLIIENVADLPRELPKIYQRLVRA